MYRNIKGNLSETEMKKYQLSKIGIREGIYKIAYNSQAEINFEAIIKETGAFAPDRLPFRFHYKHFFHITLRELLAGGYVTFVKEGKQKIYSGTAKGVPKNEEKVDQPPFVYDFKKILPELKKSLLIYLEKMQPGQPLLILELVDKLPVPIEKNSVIRTKMGAYLYGRLLDMIKRGFFVLGPVKKKYQRKKSYIRTELPFSEYLKTLL